MFIRNLSPISLPGPCYSIHNSLGVEVHLVTAQPTYMPLPATVVGFKYPFLSILSFLKPSFASIPSEIIT